MYNFPVDYNSVFEKSSSLGLGKAWIPYFVSFNFFSLQVHLPQHDLLVNKMVSRYIMKGVPWRKDTVVQITRKVYTPI